MDYSPLPPIEVLRNCFTYAPETGLLTWLERPREMFSSDKGWRIANKKCAGKRALHCRTKFGYTGRIFFQEKYIPVKTSRVVYALHHGVQPDGCIDHINGNPFDNRAVNLRVATLQENATNRARCKSGRPYHGVVYRKGKWAASIGYRRRTIWLGTFGTVEEAIRARKLAEAEFNFHPNHGRPAVRRA